ncbi:BTB/POZ domain containing protein [Nitzschia inconspicua]|uniref:BTB/POZ domain containing protein n=1 Tax=Nitzschia inconspicua TaxID=303405 RepID=A0A9K3KHV6_9STRA|nr:BTB/POZ domain containing protein [Nitzschia inconspicua]
MMRQSIFLFSTRTPTSSGLRKRAQRRLLSTTEKSPTPNTAVAEKCGSLAVAEEAADTNFVSSYQHVLRHGPGDGVITLNVGGKEFKTLQSTMQQSTVLCETVARAQANGEVLDQKVVFVDRDPTHFPLF